MRRSPEQEFQHRPLYPVIRDEYGKILKLQQGNREGEMFVEADRKDERGNQIGKVKIIYECAPGNRVGLHLEMDLKQIEKIWYDVNGKEERVYSYQYEKPAEGKDGEYTNRAIRKDVKTNDSFQQEYKWKIENGKFLPLGESFSKNDKLLSSKKYSWNSDGDLIVTESLEKDVDGTLLSHSKEDIKRRGNSADVTPSYRTAATDEWQTQLELERVEDYNDLVSRAYGTITGRLDR